MLLQLRRVAIRNYPSGQRVALFENPQLGIHLAIPYNIATGKLIPTNVIPQGKVHEDELNEAAIHRINTILKTGKEDTVLFKNGAAHPVHPKTALTVHTLFHAVNSHNKNKLAELINSSPEGLERVAKFADEIKSREAKTK